MAEGFLQKNALVSAFVPVDLQAGDNNGDWVSLKNYDRCLGREIGSCPVSVSIRSILSEK